MHTVTTSPRFGTPLKRTRKGRTGSSIPGALLWGLAMALCVAVSLYTRDASSTPHRWTIAGLYFTGGAIAFPISVYAVRRMARNRAWAIRFTTAFVSLSVLTIGATAGLFALADWFVHTPWEGDWLSLKALGQFILTVASVFYQFAAIGMRYYLPLGGFLLLAASLWLARRTH